MALVVLMRGGGDLASGVALRLHRAGIGLLITELPQPLMVRRLVSFGEAIYRGQFAVEGVLARRVDHLSAALGCMAQGEIPVVVDAHAEALQALQSILPSGTPLVLVDARMAKQPVDQNMNAAALVIGLGPGFVAGENCHAVVETNRGHFLGRAIWHGAPQQDTGIPDRVIDRTTERVLRAPLDGLFEAHAQIGDHLEPGNLVASVAGQPVVAPIQGVLRGLLHPGLAVQQGIKIGDVDPRDDPRYCTRVSDKSLAIGGGVLEAILSRHELRPQLWD
jgi:xanthine dehydrogenase accessory factor